MKTSGFTCGSALLCLVGGFLLLWPYEDDRSLWWYRSHLRIIDGQLQGLKDLLQSYREEHGNYPTNDEGLAVLDNFESRFILSYYRNLDDVRYHESPGFYGDGQNRHWWQSSKRILEEYRNEHGRAPRNQKEFCSTYLGSWFGDRPNDESEKQPTELDIAIDEHSNIFLLDESGVLSPWLLAYNYENRIGCDAGAFHGSLANGDQWGYSVQVDDGVYVSSSGGYLYAKKHNRMWWERNGPRFFGVFLILTGVVVGVYGAVRGRIKRPLLGILALTPGFLVGGFFHGVNAATCYIMKELFSNRSPEMVSLQMELLEKYRENGVIAEETYQRALSAVHREESELDDVENQEE